MISSYIRDLNHGPILQLCKLRCVRVPQSMTSHDEIGQKMANKIITLKVISFWR